jgi:uracil-DNA glycosylase
VGWTQRLCCSSDVLFFRRARWLQEELRLVDPHVVMLAGRHAMRVLLSETRGITQVGP